jgi:hypothetical protein
MRRLPLLVVCGGMFGLALAVSANAAGTAATQKTSNAGILHHGVRNAWPAETITGTIMTVDPNQQLAVVRGADQVPFDIRVTRSTRILPGDKTLTLPDLSGDRNHSVSVTFVPTGSSDIARAIHVKS